MSESKPTVDFMLYSTIQNFSALRIVHNYKMNEEEYAFYIAGLKAMTAEFKLLELAANTNREQIERIKNYVRGHTETEHGDGSSKDEETKRDEEADEEGSV